MALQKRQEPTRFPYATPVNLMTGVSDCRIEFPATFKNADAFVAFKINFKNLDAITLRDRAKEVGHLVGLTVDDIRASLKEGVELVGKRELERDGEEGLSFTCIHCTKPVLPVLKPTRSGRIMGNFRTLRVAEVAEFDSQRQAVANVTTTWFLGLEEGAPLPKRETVVVPYCTACRDRELTLLHNEKSRLEREHEVAVASGEVKHVLRVPFIPRFVRIDDVAEELDKRESRIADVVGQKNDRTNQRRFDEVVLKLKGGNTRRPSDNRDGNGRRNTGPRAEQSKWHGGLFEVRTVSALEADEAKGGVDSLEALKDLSVAEIIERGIAQHDVAAAAVIRKAISGIDYLERKSRADKVANQGRMTLGDVASSHQR